MRPITVGETPDCCTTTEMARVPGVRFEDAEPGYSYLMQCRRSEVPGAHAFEGTLTTGA
jgi:hypothetical protein